MPNFEQDFYDILKERVRTAIQQDTTDGVGGNLAEIVREQRELGDSGVIKLVIDGV